MRRSHGLFLAALAGWAVLSILEDRTAAANPMVWEASAGYLLKSLRAVLGLARITSAVGCVLGTIWVAIEWGIGANRDRSTWASWLLALFMTLGSVIVVDTVIAVTTGSVSAKVKPITVEGFNT